MGSQKPFNPSNSPQTVSRQLASVGFCCWELGYGDGDGDGIQKSSQTEDNNAWRLEKQAAL